MSNENNLVNYEKAEKDYIFGMKYKDIAEKYGVSINTVKSWKKRYSWKKENVQKVVQGCTEVQTLGNNFQQIKNDLLEQLNNNGTFGEHYIDLVDTYMELFKIKNNLIIDITERGVAVAWNNGKQEGIKKNDSIAELNKTISQMLNILNDLGLKPSPNAGGDGGFEAL